jgi:hypothetical protein
VRSSKAKPDLASLPIEGSTFPRYWHFRKFHEPHDKFLNNKDHLNVYYNELANGIQNTSVPIVQSGDLCNLNNRERISRGITEVEYANVRLASNELVCHMEITICHSPF